MPAPIIYALGAAIIRTAPHVVKYLAKQGVKQAPKFLAPARDLTRGALIGGPKHIPIGGASLGTTTTITASLRAGMQVRYIARTTARTIIEKGPQGTIGFVKYVATRAARDVINPTYSIGYYGFQGLKAIGGARGQVTKIEKYGDPVFLRVNRYLDKFGLAPTLGSVGGTFLVRGPAYGIIWRGFDTAERYADVAYTNVKKYVDRAKGSVITYGVPPQPAGNDPVLVSSPPVPPVVGNPPAVPVSPVPVGPPRVDTPEDRSRRYIPSGRR